MRPVEYRHRDIFADATFIEAAGRGVLGVVLGVPADGEIRAVGRLVMTQAAARELATKLLMATETAHQEPSPQEVSRVKKS